MRKIWCVLLALTLCLAFASLVAAQSQETPIDDPPRACPDDKKSEDCDPQKDRWGMYRMYVSASGMGYIKCGACNTSAGCTSFWTSFGKSARCEAFPAPGNKFSNWTANGQYAGTDKVKNFGKIGLRISGRFVPDN